MTEKEGFEPSTGLLPARRKTTAAGKRNDHDVGVQESLLFHREGNRLKKAIRYNDYKKDKIE